MIIHQLLYGYNDGHGRLAGSLQNITPKDSARISQMSDWSGYRDPSGKDNSYLTAYPLEDSGYYVVAKSWYASEMERPGCVWTHSLLVDITKQEEPLDLRSFAGYFQRPVKDNYNSYNKPITIDFDEHLDGRWEGWKPDQVSIIFMLSTLLSGEETFSLKVEKESEWNQQLCLTFLQFLPAGMLQRITMSSGAPSPRKMDDKPMSMQFVTMAEGISLVSPPWAGSLSVDDFSPGLAFIAKGMVGEERDMSYMLKVFSRDVGVDGKKYEGISRLLEMFYERIRNGAEMSYRDVLDEIIAYFPQQTEGEVLKTNFLSERISSFFCESEQEFLYQIATITKGEDSFTPRQILLWERVTRLTEQEPSTYQSLVDRLVSEREINLYGKQILSDSFDRLIINDYQAINDSFWDKILPYLNNNIHFLLSDKWLTLEGRRFNDVLWTFQHTDSSNYSYWDNLLDAIMHKAGYVDDAFVDTLYLKTYNCAIQVLDFLNQQDVDRWHGYLYQRPFSNVSEFVKWLGQQNKVSKVVEQYVVKIISPDDAVVRHSDSSIWRWLLAHDDDRKTMFFYIYLMQMAYNWRDQSALDFFHHSFHKVHNALGEAQQSDYVWNYVSRYGGKVYFFQEWDRCRKLRNGVVTHLKRYGYPKSVLKSFTPDSKLNETLMDIWDKI